MEVPAVDSILGKKLGMTRVFDAEGRNLPVTVIQAGPCDVMQVKRPETDGYWAVQLGFDDRKRSRATKPETGRARKANVEPKKFIREVRLAGEVQLALGQRLTVTVLKEAKHVDVTGITKGRGFAGVMKRHGFAGSPDSHGCSMRHRAPGALGRTYSIGKGVPKGKRMGGHMGVTRHTVRNLRVVAVDIEKNLLVVGGAVPGPIGGYLVVRVARGHRRVAKAKTS